MISDCKVYSMNTTNVMFCHVERGWGGVNMNYIRVLCTVFPQVHSLSGVSITSPVALETVLKNEEIQLEQHYRSTIQKLSCS